MLKTLEQLNQEFISEFVSGQPAAPPETSNLYEKWFAEVVEELETQPAPAQIQQPLQQWQVQPQPARPQPRPAQAQIQPQPVQPPQDSAQVRPLPVQTPPDSEQVQPRPAQPPPAPERYEAPPLTDIGFGAATGEPDRQALAKTRALPQTNTSEITKNKKKNTGKKASDIIFYSVVAFLLIAILLFSGQGNSGFRLFGYSGFVVLGGSMEKEIPQGSLVITRKIDPEEIKLGDDITFVRKDNATVTHRVVDIIDNYEDSGNRVFQTQGLANPDPDPDPVFEGNVIGVVKHSVPRIGFLLSYISDNIGIICIILGGILAAVAIGKILLGKREKKAGVLATA